jgi:ATP-dependent Zn protease
MKTKNKDSDSQKGTAYHEAGHLVAYMVFGFKVRKATIKLRGDALGINRIKVELKYSICAINQCRSSYQSYQDGIEIQGIS